ncbi:MAG TPA: hypothetical protein VGK73_27185 [Polyangiaceae bacterium]
MIRRGATLLALGTLSVPAAAEPPPLFELSVVRTEGAGSCPSGNEFERRVSARLGRNPFTSAAEKVIEATLSQKEDRFRADIKLRDSAGLVEGQREIDATGSDCGALAEATTLAIALTIDPDAALSPAGAPGPVEVLPPLPPAPACPAPVCPKAPPCASCPEPKTSSLRVGAVARAVLAGGLVPGAAPGFAVAAEAGSALLRAELGMVYLPEQRTEDGEFAFGLTTALAGACAALPPFGVAELGLCAELQLGALHGVVFRLSPVEPGAQPWLAASASPRLRVHAGPALFFELGASAVIPLLDHEFQVQGGDQTGFEPSALGGMGYAGLGLRSP